MAENEENEQHVFPRYNGERATPPDAWVWEGAIHIPISDREQTRADLRRALTDVGDAIWAKLKDRCNEAG